MCSNGVILSFSYLKIFLSLSLLFFPSLRLSPCVFSLSLPPSCLSLLSFLQWFHWWMEGLFRVFWGGKVICILPLSSYFLLPLPFLPLFFLFFTITSDGTWGQVIESPLSLPPHPPTMVTFKKTLPYGPGHLDCTMSQAVGEGMGAQSEGN